MTPDSLQYVRARIATAVIGESHELDTVGRVSLLPHQREAVRRATRAIARFGGALIADDVGTGKTFVALAVAAAYERPLVLAPAALRDTWTTAAQRAGVSQSFVTLESLGRGRPPPAGHDVVIVDEAHHLRNPATKRYRATVDASRGADVVLLSGTPVHNSAADLDALLALFLGASARDLDDEARAEVVVRTAASPLQPRVAVHKRCAIPDAPEVVRAIVALPTPVRARDGGAAAGLLKCGFLRAWCSSVAALTRMTRRSIVSASALIDALRTGRHLSRTELATWAAKDDGQLAFYELISAPCDGGAAVLSDAEAFVVALRRLLELVPAYGSLDNLRAQRLIQLVESHPGIPVLACTQYAATVEALWRRLRSKQGVAAMTARGGQIASGSVSRGDVLARFSPVSQGKRAPHARELIRLLITTDVVSEGVNLQDAGVIVHLDTPWTAARLAQRVGRIARVGSPHEAVHAYAIAPPRAAATLLALEQRIVTKRRTATRVVGGGTRYAELLGGGQAASESPSEAHARIIRALSQFATRGTDAKGAVVCAVAGARDGWLAMSAASGAVRLFASASASGAATANPRAVADAITAVCCGRECPLPDGWRRSQASAQRWLARERGRYLAGTARTRSARVHSRALAASAASVRNAPPHERARKAAAASDAMNSIAQQRFAPSPHLAPLSALVVFVPNDETRDPV